MAETLGSFLVTVVLIFIGVFLMIAAYSSKEVLLKIATLGTLKIDPDNPGKTPRAVMFGVGVTLVLVSLLLIVLEKLQSLNGG
jgi:divalent metal cation (Fe/Co/Zn/Cd) transporter